MNNFCSLECQDVDRKNNYNIIKKQIDKNEKPKFVEIDPVKFLIPTLFFTHLMILNKSIN